MKRFRFEFQETLQGKHRADLLEDGEFIADYIEYDEELGEGIAYGTWCHDDIEEMKELKFEVEKYDRERIAEYIDTVTAGVIFQAGWKHWTIE